MTVAELPADPDRDAIRFCLREITSGGLAVSALVLEVSPSLGAQLGHSFDGVRVKVNPHRHSGNFRFRLAS